MMFLLRTLSIIFFLLLNTTLFAQQITGPKQQAAPAPEQCKVDQRHTWLMDNDVAYRNALAANETAIQGMLNNNLNYVRNGAGILTVPIVVHVIHLGEAVGSGTNISDAQIMSAIDAINDDYRKVAGSQGDGAGVDCEIEFCLATMDPSGNATTGINRVDGSSTTSGGDNYGSMGITDNNEVAVKNLSKWPNTDYYNVWIVSEIDDNNGGSGTQGYAYYPGASATYDGAVMLYNAFGFDPTGSLGYNLKSYTDLNRTFTHEMGHALNLNHTFEGDAGGTTCPPNANCTTDGDKCCDTDPHIRSASNCPTGTNSCTGNPAQDIVRNYMDYSSEACEDEFSQDQKDRMRAALCTTRSSLLSSTACSAVSYCIPAPTNGTSDGDFVDGVVLGSISNTGTGAQNGPDYNDYTAQSTNLLAGGTYTIDITGGTYQPDRYAAWIDYNQDQDFADAGEKLGEFVSSAANQTQSITFTVPTSATAGTTRLRVRCLYNNNADGLDPCTDGDYGETEDYSVDIISYCIPNPTTGTTDGDYIDGVVLGTINNTGTGSTTGPNYNDYTSQSTNVNANSSYNLAITGGSYQPDYYAAWIDYNQDGDFDDTNEKLGEFQTSATFQTQQITFTVPASADTGDTRLRVRCLYSNTGSIAPCTNGTWGETEDYTVHISDISCPSITAVATTVDPSCGNSDGEINASAAGGSAPYTYSWSSGQSTATVTGLGAGTYTVNIVDANNCPGSGTYTLVDSGSPSVTTSSSNASCNNSADGSATASASGGASPYTYNWSNGGQTAIITGLSGGTYTVTVTGNNGCGAAATVAVTSPAAISISTSTTAPSCSGSDGTATASATGGVGQLNYLWDPSTNNQATATATGLAPGSYQLTVTDANNCSSTASVSLAAQGGPTLTAIGSDVSCNGSNDGSASVLANGGTSPYSYSWSTGGNIQIITGLSGGVYTITVTDANNCAAVDQVTIVEPDSIGANPSMTEPDCGQANGSITIGATGGAPGYSYQWSSGGNSATESNLTAGVYTCTITDLNGCSAAHSVNLNTNPGSGGPNVNVVSNDVTCAGASDGSAAVTTTSGTAPFSFSWSDGNTTAINVDLPAGNYTVTVTDATGCGSIELITISEPPALDLTFTQVQPECGFANGEIAVNVSGGTSPYSYDWTGGYTTATVTGLSAGVYYITVTDAAGCDLELPIGLNNDPSSGGPQYLTTENDASCYNEADGSVAVSVTSGTAPFTYQWSDGATGAIRIDLPVGTYYFTVADADGCVSSDSVSVGSPPAPSFSTSTTDANCGVSDGTASVVASGGTPPFIYLWGQGTGFQTGQTATGLAAGSYQITIAEANDCETEMSVAIDNLNAPDVVVSGTDVPCFGGADGFISLAVSGGQSPYQYNWSDGSTGQNLIGVEAGTYTVTVTDAAGCLIVVEDTVHQPDAALTSTATSIPASDADSCNGAGFSTAFGGTPPYSYVWNDPQAQTTPAALDLCAGAYSVTITDNNSCATIQSVSIGVGSGLASNPMLEQIAIYPNPTDGVLRADILANANELDVRVYSSTGQLVAVNRLTHWGRGIVLADLSNLSNGLYVIEIANGSYRTRSRIQLLK